MAVVTGTDNPATLSGTDADDTIFGLAGDDIIEGGGGFDLAAYWTSPFAISVRLFAGVTDNDGFGGRDTLNNIEGVAGTAFDGVIYSTDLGNYVQGVGGNDTVVAFGGDDIIRVAEGDDFVDGGSGTDRLFFIASRADHTVTAIPGGFRIVDNVPNRYGTDTVLDVELLQFANTQLTADQERPVWHLRQIICDDQDFNEWFFEGEIDFDRSRDLGRPVLDLLRFGS